MLTFPATRRTLARILDAPVLGVFVITAGMFLLTLPYIGLRAIADNGRAGADGSRLENSLFGGSPTTHLQGWLYSGQYGWLERTFVYIHISWFLVPPLLSLIVLLRWRDEIRSYVAWHTAALYGAAICFLLVPVSPPWMTESGVTRIIAHHSGGAVGVDNNPLAAMPSLHVALPLTLALWLLVHHHRTLGNVMVGYSLLVGFGVVFLGEHYVVDVLGAAALACSICFASALIEGRAAAHQEGRVVEAAATSRMTPASERGQNLVEFAMLAPFIMMLIAIIVVLGLAINARSSLQQAVREGARQASVGKSLADVQNLAAGNAPDQLAASEVKVCYPVGSTGTMGEIGDPVRVYLFDGGAEGHNYTLVSTGGILDALGLGSLDVRMAPRATGRLEKTVNSPNACP